MFYLSPSLKGFQRLLILLPLLFAPCGQVKAQEYKSIPATVVADAESGSTSVQDGLSGPVRRVRTEVAALLPKDGKLAEGRRVLLETIVYSRQGRKVDHSVHSVTSSPLVGRETYKYDDRGNIIEMTVRDDAGSVVSQEIYAYEFDALGNWTKMTTSVAVVENNNTTYEPTEITYRSITYYRTDAVAKAILAPAGPAGAGPASAANPAQMDGVSEKGERKQAVGLAADEKVQSAGDQQVTPGQPAAASVNEGAPHSPAPAEKSDAAGGDTGAEKTAGGGSNKSEPPADDPPAAELPAPKPPVKAISAGILNGRAINLPKPIYPDLAKRAGQEGTVSVEVLIDVTGKVISANAVSGPLQLRRVAVDAARRARFTPTLLSGQPMRVSGVINYNFSLEQ